MKTNRIGLTIVLNIFSLLLGTISRDPMNLHPHQGIHNGAFFAVGYFGKLLPTNDLEEKITGAWKSRPDHMHNNIAIPYKTYITQKGDP